MTKYQRPKAFTKLVWNTRPQFLDRKLIKRVKAKLWTRMLVFELGLSGRYALQKLLSRPNSFKYKSEGTKYPTFAYKYHSGEHLPSPKIVKRAEQHVSNASYLLNLPMWHLFERDITQAEINEYLLQSSPELSNKLFKSSGCSGALLERKKIKSYRTLATWLSEKSTIESFNVLLLLLAEAEDKKEHNKFEHYRNHALKVIINLFQKKPFNTVEFFLTISRGVRKRFFNTYIRGNFPPGGAYIEAITFENVMCDISTTPLMIPMMSEFKSLCDDSNITKRKQFIESLDEDEKEVFLKVLDIHLS